MKFLCVPCDRPMQLLRTAPPERGSIRLLYGCPDCGYEFAMLTNPHETQVVGSLGVKIGAEEGSGSAAASKCPFTGVVRELTASTAGSPVLTWTARAEERMAAVPEFLRPMVRAGIERFARERGHACVDERVLEEARAALGPGAAPSAGSA